MKLSQLPCRRRRRSLLVWLLLLPLLATAFLLAWRRSGPVGADTADVKQSLPPPLRPPPQRPTSQTSPPPTLPSVPRRLHHYFGDSVAIPRSLAQAVHSWANNHKNYDVYFWDSRFLESRLLPRLQLYGQYRSCYQAERHTVARLLILLSQGGVLVDPGLISLRDFASFLDGSGCVLAQERPEVAALVHGLGSLPSLRFAACRPDHPFVRLFLASFCRAVAARTSPEASSSPETATAAATQAAFDAAVAAYDDSCARRVCDHRDRVVLASPMVFLPVVPPRLMARLTSQCAEATAGDSLHRDACRSLLDSGNRNQPGMMSMAMLVEPSQAEDRELLPLDRIGRNVGRRPITNWLLPKT